MELLIQKVDKLENEAVRLLHTKRDLERENAMLRDRIKKEDLAMVYIAPSATAHPQNKSTFAAVILNGDEVLVGITLM